MSTDRAVIKSERETPDPFAARPGFYARALGFRLLSVVLVFTPVFPLIDYYEGLNGNVRTCYVNLRNLVAELFIGARSYIRVVCEESKYSFFSF
jgi:hypothetical protein